MTTISLRVEENEKKTMQDYAKLKGLSLSQLIRESIFEKIEDEIDLDLYYKAVKEYRDNPETAISFEQALEELGLNE